MISPVQFRDREVSPGVAEVLLGTGKEGEERSKALCESTGWSRGR